MFGVKIQNTVHQCHYVYCTVFFCMHVHTHYISSQGADGLRRFSLRRLTFRWLHPSCSLPCCCQNLWHHSSRPKQSYPPLLQSVSLLLACSHSVPAPAGLGDQEPGLPWQLVLSLSLDGSSLDSVTSNSPQYTYKSVTRAEHLHLGLFQHRAARYFL